MKSIEGMVQEPEVIQLIGKAMALFLGELNTYLNSTPDIHPMLLQTFLPQIVDVYFNYLLSLPSTNVELDQIKQAFVQQNLIKLLEEMPENSKMH